MDTSGQKIRNILANTPLFKLLGEHELERIVANTVAQRTSTGVALVGQGDRAGGMYWVVYGQLKVSVSSKQGGEVTLAILGPGKCFGLGEMVLDQPYVASVKTTADCLLLHIGREAVLDLAAGNPAFGRALLTRLGRQFYALMEDIESYAQSARQRVARYLLRHSERANSPEIELVANKVVVASRLSVTPETLSRLFRDFSAEGLIAVSRRRITILDAGRLAAQVA
jgi:CRP-like cAMP-binding protein